MVLRFGRPPTLSDISPSGSAACLFVGGSGLFVGGSAAGLFVGSSGLFVGGSAAGLFVGGFITFVAFLMLERSFAIFLFMGMSSSESNKSWVAAYGFVAAFHPRFVAQDANLAQIQNTRVEDPSEVCHCLSRSEMEMDAEKKWI